MHTLPLPEVPTDAYPNAPPEASRKFESPSPPRTLAPPTGHTSTPPGVPVPRGRLTPQQLQFLLRVAPPALLSERAYGIPAPVTIAQAILESATSAGWGSSSLFRLANNPFGIKARDSRLVTRDSGLGAWDTGPGTRDTGVASSEEIADSGFRIPQTRDSRLATGPPSHKWRFPSC